MSYNDNPYIQKYIKDYQAKQQKQTQAVQPQQDDAFARWQKQMGYAEPEQPLASTNDTVGNDDNAFSPLLYAKDAADAGLFSSLAGMARFGAEFSPFGGETLNRWADSADEVVQRNTPTHELYGLDWWGNAGGNAVGSMIPTAALTLAAGGVGGALGLGARAAGVISKLPAGTRALSAAKAMWASPYGKFLATNVGSSPAEGVVEAGNLITDMRNQGYSDEDIKEAALKSAAANTAFLTVANLLEAKTLGKIADKFAKQQGKKALAQAAARGAAADAISEGFEEFGQNLIGNWAQGADPDYDEAIEAAKQGAAGGALLGGVGVGFGAYTGRKANASADAAPQGEMVETTQEEQAAAQEAQTAALGSAQEYLDNLYDTTEEPAVKQKIRNLGDEPSAEEVIQLATEFGWQAPQAAAQEAQPQAEEQPAQGQQTAQAEEQLAQGEEQALQGEEQAPQGVAEDAQQYGAGEQRSAQAPAQEAARTSVWAYGLKGRVLERLADNKKGVSHVTEDGTVNYDSIRKSLHVKQWMEQNQNVLETTRRALVGDMAAQQEFDKLTPLRQTAVLDALENGAELYRITDKERMQIRKNEANARKAALVTLKQDLKEAARKAKGITSQERAHLFWVAAHGNEQITVKEAKKLGVKIPQSLQKPANNALARALPAGKQQRQQPQTQIPRQQAVPQQQAQVQAATVQAASVKPSAPQQTQVTPAQNAQTAQVAKTQQAQNTPQQTKAQNPAPQNAATQQKNTPEQQNKAAQAVSGNTLAGRELPTIHIGNVDMSARMSDDGNEVEIKVPAGTTYAKQEMDDIVAAGLKYKAGRGFVGQPTQAVREFINKYRIEKGETQNGKTNSKNSKQNKNSADTASGQAGENEQGEHEGAGKDGEAEEVKLAEGYRTQSGKPLSEADAKELIILPSGSDHFGEITKEIENATNGELKAAPIKLNVGNEKAGLIHAKKHESQALIDGYKSIEDMMLDVATNFDEIYRHDNLNGGAPTYVLVKYADNKIRGHNGVAPVYFEINSDGKGNYYLIITAIPKGDRSLARQLKKEHLVYSSPGIDTATVSANSTVPIHGSNQSGTNRGGIPTSDKQDVPIDSSVTQNAGISNERQKEKPLPSAEISASTKPGESFPSNGSSGTTVSQAPQAVKSAAPAGKSALPKADANGIMPVDKSWSKAHIKEVQDKNSKLLMEKAQAIKADWEAGEMSLADAQKAITAVYQKYAQSRAAVKAINNTIIDEIKALSKSMTKAKQEAEKQDSSEAKVKSEAEAQARAKRDELAGEVMKQADDIVKQHADGKISDEEANERVEKLYADLVDKLEKENLPKLPLKDAAKLRDQKHSAIERQQKVIDKENAAAEKAEAEAADAKAKEEAAKEADTADPVIYFKWQQEAFKELSDEVDNLYDESGKLDKKAKADFDKKRAKANALLGSYTKPQKDLLDASNAELEIKLQLVGIKAEVAAAQERFDNEAAKSKDNILLAANEIAVPAKEVETLDSDYIHDYLYAEMSEREQEVLQTMGIEGTLANLEEAACVDYAVEGKVDEEVKNNFEELADDEQIAVAKKYANLIIKVLKVADKMQRPQLEQQFKAAVSHKKIAERNVLTEQALKKAGKKFQLGTAAEADGKRAYNEIVARLTKEFGATKVEQADGDMLIMTTASGDKYAVHVADEIVVNQAALNEARRAHGIADGNSVVVEGVYRPVTGSDIKGIIDVSLYSKGGTETHEITHAVIDNAASVKEQAVLFDRAEKIAKEFGLKADAEELACDAVQAFVIARENGYATTFTQGERAELNKTSWGKMLLNLNRAGRKGQLFSELNQEKLSKTPWGRVILAKYKLQRLLGKIFSKIYDFVKSMQSVFTGVESFHNVARKIESGRIWSESASKNGGTARYQAVGVHSRTANKERLAIAKEMQANGETPEVIYEATGWWQGQDTRWRYEIPDHIDSINFDALDRSEYGKSVTLAEIYDNAELYEAYPQLKDVSVRIEPMELGLFGVTNMNGITLNDIMLEQDKEALKSTLIHEVQHAIQDIEGFASGGNSDEISYDIERTLQKQGDFLYFRYLNIDDKMPWWKRRLAAIEGREKRGEKPKPSDAKMKETLQKKIADAEGKFVKSHGVKGQAELEEIKAVEKSMQSLNFPKEEMDAMVNEILEENPWMYGEEASDMVETQYGATLYKALHGEQEARNTSRRAKGEGGKYPWQGYEGHFKGQSIILVDPFGSKMSTSNAKFSARPRRSADAKVDDINQEYKHELEKAYARNADVYELTDIMNKHLDKLGEHLDKKAAAAKEKAKVRVKELRELREKFSKGKIDQYQVGGAIFKRDDKGQIVVEKITSDLAKRTYVNRRREGKTFDTPTQKMADVVHQQERKGFLQKGKDFVKDQREHFYRNWIDKYDDLGKFDKAVKEKGIEVKSFDSIKNATQRIQNSSNGKAQAMIEGNAENLKVLSQQYGFKINKSFKMIMDELHKRTPAMGTYLKKNFGEEYANDPEAAANHALASYLAAEQLLEGERVHMADYNEEVARWEQNGSKGKPPRYEGYRYAGGLTKAECEAVVKATPAGLKKLAQDYYQLNKDLLHIMVKTNLISAETEAHLNKRYEHYCPLMRDFSDTEAVDAFIGQINAGGKGIANVSDPLRGRRSEGSSRDLVSPLEMTVKSVANVIARGERNKVGLMLVDRAKQAGLDNLVRRMEGTSGDAKNCIYTVMRGGKKEAYQTTPELYPAVTMGFEPAIKVQWALLTTPAKMLRLGSTSSPQFIVSNLLRDTIFAGISSKNGFIPIVDSIRGAMELLNNPQLRAEFENSGISSSATYGSLESIAERIDEMTGGKKLSGTGDILKAAVKMFENGSDFVEAMTRMGEFAKARKNNKSIEEAAQDAVEITLNFGRSGVEGQQANKVIPFFNACIQGADKVYRLFRDDFVGTSMKIGQYIILPSLLLWAANHDEDWYKELDPNVKATNWVLPGGVKIPKPQEVGYLFGTGTEAILTAAYDNDPKAMTAWVEAVKEALMPGILPTAILPIIEWQANYSMFRGKPVENQQMQRLPEKFRFGDYTSETSKFIGDKTNLSPAKIDNLVRSVTGTMGMALWQVPDLWMPDKLNLPEKKWNEQALTRRFFVNDMEMRRTMSDLYELHTAAQQQHAAYGKKGSVAKDVSAINTAYTSVSKISKKIREVTADTRLNSEQKRKKIDALKVEQRRIAQLAIKRFGSKYGI